MGKASRKKRQQQESQAESILNGKSLISSDISSKWSLLNKPAVHILLIIISGFLVYSNTFNVPFQWDDTPNIVANYKLKDLTNFWPPSDSRWFGFLTFALNYHFGGLDTLGYHIVNLAIHILNAILVYWLVLLALRTPIFSNQQAISGQDNTEPHSPIHPFTYLPLFIALIFVAHPIQTQAVTYIVQRFTSLATFFYLLSLVMYIKFRLTPSLTLPPRGGGMGGGAAATRYSLHATRYILYAVSLVSAILAMKTKEIAFTLPIIIALYELMFFGNNRLVIPVKTGIQDKNEMDSLFGESSEAICLRGNDRVESGYKKLLYLIPFLLTLLIIPLSLIGIDKPIGDAIGELREAAQETEDISRWSYLFTQFRVIVTYIRLLVLPINQNLDYDYPLYHSFFEPEVFLSVLFLLSIFAFGIYLLHSKRYTLSASRFLAFGIFWFFITLSVESSIIPIRDVIFEHRLYLPSVGVFIAITTSVFILASKLKKKWPQIEKTVTPILALIVIILSIAAYARNIVWQDEISLWEDVVKKSPEKARGHYNLGLAYYYQGRRLDEAIQAYHIALRLKPDYVEAHNNLGLVYHDQGRLDEAIQAYLTALRLKPDFPKAYNNLGLVYHDQGRLDEAIQAYLTALRLKSDDVKAYNNLANVYHDQGRLDEAIQAYLTALRLKPDYVKAYYNLGVTYERMGLLDEAIKQYQTALRLNPEHKIAENSLNRILQIQRSK